jgi:hypothetical protein
VILEEFGITDIAAHVSTERWRLTSSILKIDAPRLAAVVRNSALSEGATADPSINS